MFIDEPIYVELTDFAPNSCLDIPPSSSPSLPPSPDDLLRCSRCKEFYKGEESDNMCYFHPGRYIDPREIEKGIMVGWSCCIYLMKEGKREYNPHASDRRLRGCVGMMGHKEDEDLSHMMRMARGKKGEWNEVRVEGHGKEGWVAFEEDGAHLGERVGRVGEGKGKEIDEMEEKEVEEEEEEKLKEEEGGERKGFIEHKIQRSDTLFKLSLMYDVTVDEIRAANMISSSNNFIQHHSTLRIPYSSLSPPPPLQVRQEGKNKGAISKAFLGQVGGEVDALEADYFLEEADWDLKKALHLWKESEEWGKQNAPPLSLAPSPTLAPVRVQTARRCC